jgi:hypothetical protein
VTLAPVLVWLQSTRVATIVGESQLLTGFLSSVHLLGLTLIVGSVLFSSLRLLGVVFPERPAPDVIGPARHGIVVGLGISVTTGLLLFAPRATAASESGFFQLKMALLLAAVVFHGVVYRSVTKRADVRPLVQRLAGSVALALWFGVALAACAFIFLE